MFLTHDFYLYFILVVIYNFTTIYNFKYFQRSMRLLFFRLSILNSDLHDKRINILSSPRIGDIRERKSINQTFRRYTPFKNSFLYL